MDKKPPLLIITGPTAVGKTALSVELALKVKGEIISADSMQVYQGMDIGTAKIREEEKCGIPHHLIDILKPDEDFNVTIFKEMAEKCIEDIRTRDRIPIIAGGTGFYIQSVLYDVEFAEFDEEKRSCIKRELEALFEKNGIDDMYRRLMEIDPEYARVIHKNNIRRVLHGLEYHMLTGGRLSEHNEEQRERTSPYNFLYCVLNDDRSCVYDRINRRVDEMMKEGLEDEVRTLLNKGYSRALPSMQGLGYKEIADYICGECTLDTAVGLIKRDTRHFAKKQLTWFKREKEVFEVNRTKFSGEEEIIKYVLAEAERREIIS